jgi:hypothetical protein
MRVVKFALAIKGEKENNTYERLYVIKLPATFVFTVMIIDNSVHFLIIFQVSRHVFPLNVL